MLCFVSCNCFVHFVTVNVIGILDDADFFCIYLTDDTDSKTRTCLLYTSDTNLENAWFGVTVTRKAERWRIDALRKNVRAKYYHVTFEPLFDDPGTVDLSGINWIVVGTMTGAQSRKIHTEPEWAWSLTDQAHKLGIPVFMKEDLVPIIGLSLIHIWG